MQGVRLRLRVRLSHMAATVEQVAREQGRVRPSNERDVFSTDLATVPPTQFQRRRDRHYCEHNGEGKYVPRHGVGILTIKLTGVPPQPCAKPRPRVGASG